ncbi:indolepyruvate ferredoxin oxidoreductase subunit alpha [Evansella tamaricis]|nr:ferredoxin family protein [Evansella tamaricis]
MRIIIKEDYCKGCSLCIAFCPQEIIQLANRLNRNGYRPAEVLDQNKCTSCAACARMCPDSVISVFRPEKNKIKAS